MPDAISSLHYQPGYEGPVNVLGVMGMAVRTVHVGANQKLCSACDGKGKTRFRWGAVILISDFRKCTRCKGTGLEDVQNETG